MTLRCTESHATFNDHGFPRVLAAGDVVADDDPAVLANPSKFERVEVHIARQPNVNTPLTAAQGVLETASSAPGEVRQVRAPRKRAAAKKATAKKAAGKPDGKGKGKG